MDTETEDDDKKVVVAKKNGRGPDPAADVASAEAQSISDWLKQSFEGDLSIKIKLHRNAPATYMNQPTKGYLTEYQELINEDQVKETYGGGVYRLHTFRLDANGNWKMGGTKVFTIAGNPRIEEHALPKVVQDKMNAGILPLSGGMPPSPSAVDQAMTMMSDVAKEDRKRADKLAEELRANTKFDPEMIEQVIRPYQTQLDALAQSNRALQDQLTIALNRKPETGFQDKLLDKMIDGESIRLGALRDQHASELRTLKENHEADLRRREDANAKREERAHTSFERELTTMKSAAEMQVKSIEIAYQGRIEGLNVQIATLTQALADTRQELVALRSQKDEGPLDQLTKLAALKDALKGFSGGDDDDGPAEPSTFEKIAAAAAPMIQGISDRLANSGGQPGQPQQMQMQPAQLEAPAGPAPTHTQFGVTKSELQQAISFVELAIRNGTPPVTFAASARSQIPGALIENIKAMGADEFIKVLPLKEGSPLATFAGTQYLRAVIKVLVEPAA